MSGQGIPRISAVEAMKAVSHGAALLDIREQPEWDAGHSPVAEFIALSILGGVQLPKWGDRQVMVICRSGQRSREAAAYLTARGVDAYSVDGGMREWQLLGGEVVAADGTAGQII